MIATAPTAPSASDLLGLRREQLRELLEPWVDQRYRADQIYHALYRRGITELSAMTELGGELRRRLAARFAIGVPTLERVAASADGTRKFLLALADGATIEAVLIPDRTRRTLCLSSQAGCPLGCTFCVTGYWGAGRNLSAGEIVGQLLVARREQPNLATQPLNLVFMGMGEPLLNLEALAAALDLIAETVAWRRITLSTAGVVPGIEALASWRRRPHLAVSLHAPDDARRSEIMPINRRYPLRDLFTALRSYAAAGRQRLSFEYTLIRGFNDDVADARAVARRLAGLRARVNLIPVNSDPVLGPTMVPPAPATTRAFQRALIDAGVACSIRQRRGDDIQAACGQLRAYGREPRGFTAAAR